MKSKFYIQVYRTLKLAAINRYPGTLLYIANVVLINTLFLYIPLISVMGTTMTPADFIAGSIYVFRDFAQREIKHYIIFAMMIACVLSYLLANRAIALASFSAFTVAELTDWGIFTYTKKSLSQRLLSSSLVSAPLDSLVFCAVAGMLTWLDFILMTLAKFFGVLIIWYIWKLKKVNYVAAS